MSSKTVSSEGELGGADELRVVSDVACTRCGCLCDDIQTTIEGPRIVAVSMPGALCPIAESWFLAQRGDDQGGAFVNGRRIAPVQAIVEAARLLKESTAPLVYGLTHSSTNGQRAAVALADRIGAYLDVPTSPTQSAALSAFQNAGASTSTLGEVRERSDLVIFWGCNPEATHPRHLPRFVNAPGKWVTNGRTGRHVISIRSEDHDATFADASVNVARGRDAELIATMRSLVTSADANSTTETDVSGVSATVINELAERMRTCKYGVIFYGDDLVKDASDKLTVESLHRLVTELNAHARFTVRYMSGSGNATGAANVLAWQTGYPANVDFSAGYPRYRPDECVASTLLEQSAVDAAVIVGEESLASLSPGALAQLQEIPVILLTHTGLELPVKAAVQFETATPGVHERGTAYRMDDVSLPLRLLFESDCILDDEIVLQTIATRVGYSETESK